MGFIKICFPNKGTLKERKKNMRIPNEFNACVLAKTADPSKDGTKVYYNLGILIIGTPNLGSVSCTEEVYQKVKPDNEVVYKLKGEYSTDYKTFRIVDVISSCKMKDFKNE